MSTTTDQFAARRLPFIPLAGGRSATVGLMILAGILLVALPIFLDVFQTKGFQKVKKLRRIIPKESTKNQKEIERII